MQIKSTFNATGRRHLLTCLFALITSVVIIPGMTTYLPFAFTEQILLPIMLFPLIWTALLIYAYMAEKVWQPFALMLVLTLSHGTLCFVALSGGQS